MKTKINWQPMKAVDTISKIGDAIIALREEFLMILPLLSR